MKLEGEAGRLLTSSTPSWLEKGAHVGRRAASRQEGFQGLSVLGVKPGFSD